MSLGSPQRVLAGRALAILNQADAGNEVPFHSLNTLGGNYCLRGYNELRFRDTNLVCFSAEYRWEGAPALEFAFFADAGQVFPDTSDFEFEDLRTSYGFGVRFKTPSATFMRFDTAHSKEGTRFLVNFGASF